MFLELGSQKAKYKFHLEAALDSRAASQIILGVQGHPQENKWEKGFTGHERKQRNQEQQPFKPIATHPKDKVKCLKS